MTLGTASKVRIAILIDAAPMRWQASCLQQLLEQDNLVCALEVRHPSLSGSRRWCSALLGRHLFPRSLLPARAPSAMAMLRGSNDADLIAAVREFSPHIILYLDGDEPNSALQKIAPDGVWRLRVDGYSACDHCWFGWLGRIGDRRVISATLEVAGDGFGDNKVLQRGHFRIKPHSVGSSVDTLFATIATWPSKYSGQRLSGVAANRFEADTTNDHAGRNGVGHGIWQFCKLVGRFAMRALKRPFEEEQWGVGVVDRPVEGFLDGQPLRDVRWLTSSGCPRFVADPFGVVRNNTLYVFHERMDPGARQGVIAWYETTGDDQPVSASINVIQQDAHLSYPFLLRHQGKDYCVPESAQAEEVAIYEAVEFPHRWRKAGVLLTETIVFDPTLFEHQGRWWLFGAGAEDGGQLTLQIWYADELFGPWQPHPGNPVKTDVRSARPAGTPFFHDGHWYRPAQDCSRTYGGSVVINRIDRLSPTEYEERVVAGVDPGANDRYRDGLHTLSGVGKCTLIDGKRLSYSLGGFLRRCRKGWA